MSEYIKDGNSMFIDLSSTSVFIMKELTQRENLKIITNSIEVILETSAKTGWQTIATGGDFFGDYLGMSGEKTIDSIRSYHTNWAVISCKGMSEKFVLTEVNDSFAFAKRAMIKQADRVILAIDHTKFGMNEFACVCDVRDIDIVVTDTCPTEPYLRFLEQNNIKCIYPGNDGNKD